MKLYGTLTISAIALIGLAMPAFARVPGVRGKEIVDRPATINALETASEEAARHARGTKGSGQSLYLMKRVQLNDLIERLQKGEQVAPEEIERAFKR